MQFAVECFPGSFTKPKGYLYLVYPAAFDWRRADDLVAARISRGADGVLIAAADVRHRFKRFGRVPLPRIKTYECPCTEGLGSKDTPEGKALSVWTRQLCLCDIEAMSTTRAVDLLPVLLLIALIG